MIDHHQALPDSEDEDEYTASKCCRQGKREKSAPKKAQTDDGPASADSDPMNLSVPQEDKKHGLEGREQQRGKSCIHQLGLAMPTWWMTTMTTRMWTSRLIF